MSEYAHHNGLELTLIEHCDGTLFFGIHLGYGILNECEVVVCALIHILTASVIHEDCFVDDFLEQADNLRIAVRRFAFLFRSDRTDEVVRLLAQFRGLDGVHIGFTEREECEQFRTIVSPRLIKVSELTELFEVDTGLLFLEIHAIDRAIVLVAALLDLDGFDVELRNCRNYGVLGFKELCVFNLALALIEYLDSFDIMHHSYRMGGTLGCQLSQIRQLGMLDVCLDYYKEHQNKDNGVWQDTVDYHAVNGLMKIAGVFVTYGPFPNYDKAIDTAMEVMMSDEVPKAVVDFFNPWRAALEILDSLRNQGMEEEAKKQQDKIMARSAELINKTTEKMRDFVKPDGSVSYFRNYTSSESQRVKVALYQEPEGDVNATGLAIGGSIKRPLEVLGVKDVGLYDENDYKRFLELIAKQKPPVKKPHPEGR